MMHYLELFLRDILPFHMFFSVQILAAELMFVLPLKKRGSRLKLPLFCLLYLIICWFHPTLGNRFVRVFCILLESMLVLYAAVDLPMDSVLFIGIASYAIQNMAFQTGCIFMALLPLQSLVMGYVISGIVFVILYVLGYDLFVRRFPAGGKVFIQKKVYYALTIITLAFVFVRSIMLGEGASVSERIFTVLSILVVLILQFETLRRSEIEEENAIIVHLLAQEQTRQKMLMENAELINMKSHDLKYHIDKYKQENNLEAHAGFFREVEDAVNIYDRIARTGSSALDAVLSEKFLYCEAKGIVISYLIDAAVIAFLDPSDIYSLFGNALDNAIESVLKEKEENRLISVNVRMVKECPNIVIDNYCSHLPELKNGLPVTTKEEGMHGYGLRSIRYIVQKYGGSMQIGLSGHLFTLTLLFPPVIPVSQEN